MKTTTILLIILAFVLSACSAAAQPTAAAMDSYVSDTLDTSYEGALSVRNQLALGTLKLADTPQAVTPAQAETLIVLWQALLNSTQTGLAVEAEVNATLQSLEDGLADEQIAAIKAMNLTQTDLQEWASANGITLGSGGGAGGGQGQGMSPEARATRQAEEGRTPGSSGGGASTAILSAVIGYLESIRP